MTLALDHIFKGYQRIKVEKFFSKLCFGFVRVGSYDDRDNLKPVPLSLV